MTQQLKHGHDDCRLLTNMSMLLLLLLPTLLSTASVRLLAGTAAASWLVPTCTQQEQPLCG
jgi:hypothetical protein